MSTKRENDDTKKTIYWYDVAGYYYGSNTIKDTLFILNINKSRLKQALDNQNSLVRKRYLLSTKKVDRIKGGYRNKYKEVQKRDKIDFPIHAFTLDGYYIKTYTNYGSLKQDVKPTCIGNIPRSLDIVGRTEDNRIWTSRDMRARESREDFSKFVQAKKTRIFRVKQTKSAGNGISVYLHIREDGKSIYRKQADFTLLEDFTKMLKLNIPKGKINKLNDLLPYKYGDYIIAPKSENDIFSGRFNDNKTFKL